MKYRKIQGKGLIHRAICMRCEKDLEFCGSMAQKYCQECKPIVDREKSKERMRKYRQKLKEKGANK